MASSENADVLILGAGPAGCAAAITARQAGLSVVMLEAQAGPRVAPGETLHPGVEVIFAQLGVWPEVNAAGFHRHTGIWRKKGDVTSFDAYGRDERGNWLGFQAERQKLHAILQAAVVSQGGCVIRPITPLEVLREGARVVGASTRIGSFRGGWTLDATGRHGWLAKALALPAQTHSPPLRVRFGWRDGEPAELECQPGFAQHSRGWDWMAPQGYGRSSWVSLRFSKEDAKAGADADAGADFTWRVHRACAGGGYMLLGDAAALLDPGASNGVLRALMSGIYAVHVIKAIQRGRVEESAGLAEYTQWMGEMFDHHARKLRSVYFAENLSFA
jgi:flavin-dependent dehydrogenase